jgi:hypothetical protein
MQALSQLSYGPIIRHAPGALVGAVSGFQAAYEGGF